jgi:hypothetical protein
VRERILVDLRAGEKALGVLVLPRQHNDVVVVRQRLGESGAVLRDAAADGWNRPDEGDAHVRHTAEKAGKAATGSGIGMTSLESVERTARC